MSTGADRTRKYLRNRILVADTYHDTKPEVRFYLGFGASFDHATQNYPGKDELSL